jgi:hypothetical protein
MHVFAFQYRQSGKLRKAEIRPRIEADAPEHLAIVNCLGLRVAGDET